MSRTSDNETAALAVALPSFLAAFGILAWHLFRYLKDGEWPTLSIITVMQWSGNTWALSPTSWPGLYRVLDWIPLGVAALAVGFFAIFSLATNN